MPLSLDQRSLQAPWRIVDELIEQPSWGGRYIIDLKGLGSSEQWSGKKVGQSYELSRKAKLFNPADDSKVTLADLIASDPAAVLGAPVLTKFGADISLLIKLTQAKGNSFQVHLPEGKTLGHWEPKPEAWFYLAPGLFTFGIKLDKSFTDFSNALHKIDDCMRRLSDEVKGGQLSLDEAKQKTQELIASVDPYQYVNVVVAEADQIIDLTAGGIHHSWEEDNERFPDGNLVYEVQVDVPDERCSMRGFDKGKFLPDGSLRPTHVADYLATIEQDAEHNELSRHISKPQLLSEQNGAKVEALFRTPYFNLDRISIEAGAEYRDDASGGFHHLFIHAGNAQLGDTKLAQGQSYLIPAATGIYNIAATEKAAIFKTYLPV